MALVVTESYVYEPSFDENIGNYVDKCPYRPYQRNRTTYKCLCSSTASFSTITQFNAHIKGKGHKDFIENYEKHTKLDKDTEKEIKQYRADNELLRRQLAVLKTKKVELMENLAKRNELVSELKKENEEDSQENSRLRASLRKNMNNIIKNKDDIIKQKDDEIENLKSTLQKKEERINYLEIRVDLEDEEYKDIINCHKSE